MRYEQYYPIKPSRVSRGWGYKDSFYKQFGFDRHNGKDYVAPIGNNIRWPVPCKGKVVRIGNQPTGGGLFVGVITDTKFTFDDGKETLVLLDFLHCSKILVKEGDYVETGQILAEVGNTGASTGPHCHVQPRRVTYDGSVINTIDKNDANNSFDTTPYENRFYASDYKKVEALQEKIVEVEKELTLIQKIINWLLGR